MNPTDSETTPYERLMAALQARTQAEAAERLGVRQAVLSDCKRRGMVTGSVLELAGMKGINPDWITRGRQPMRLSLPAGGRRHKGCTRYCLEECPARAAMKEALRLLECCPHVCLACDAAVREYEEQGAVRY